MGIERDHCLMTGLVPKRDAKTRFEKMRLYYPYDDSPIDNNWRVVVFAENAELKVPEGLHPRVSKWVRAADGGLGAWCPVCKRFGDLMILLTEFSHDT